MSDKSPASAVKEEPQETPGASGTSSSSSRSGQQSRASDRRQDAGKTPGASGTSSSCSGQQSRASDRRQDAGKTPGASGTSSSRSGQQSRTSDRRQDAGKTPGGASVANNTLSEGADSDSTSVDQLQDFMNRILHIHGQGGPEGEDVPRRLEDISLEGIGRYIQSGKCRKIVTMVGAGISTSAGIPDFRSPGSGLYDNLHQYNLPHPQAVFMIDFFRENPKPFFALAKELFPGSLKPTLCHYFIQMLHMKGLLLRHYTQNIDTLERVAGLPSAKLVEAHGTFNTAHCLECEEEYSLPWTKERIFADEIPTCVKKKCTGVVKPDIVFFGESLPPRFSECVPKDLKQCDLLIIMGTSLVVQPFASLVTRLPPTTPRLYINLEKPPSGREDMLSLLLGGGGNFNFDAEDNYRDVFQQVTCDDGCAMLANMLGWGDELRTLMKEGHERIDKEMAAEEGKGQASGASSL
ncbi:hypothetical protein ACOMHN_000871 [Nucella lapillus]